MKVYVCSPYAGNVHMNKEKAKLFCRHVVDQGHTPLAPHLLFPQFMEENTERERAIQMGLEVLEMCDEVWVLAPCSNGMRREINHAMKLGKKIRVFKEEE